MSQRPLDKQTLTPPVDLLGATVQFYARAFHPLFITAALAATVPTLLGILVQPGALVIAVIWTTLLLAIELGAHTAVLWNAHCIRRGRQLNAKSAIGAAIAFGPRYFTGAFLLIGMAVLAASTIVLLPLAVYLAIRFSLYGPAIVLEDRNLVNAFTRSWRLIEERWWRTFAMEMTIFVAPMTSALITAVLMDRGASVPLLFFVNLVLTALVIPLLMVFSLLLFEDYRRVSDAEPRYEHEREHHDGRGE